MIFFKKIKLYLFLLTIIFGLVFLVYSNNYSSPFYFDDPISIHFAVKDKTFSEYMIYALSSHRMLPKLTFGLNYYNFGISSLSFHIVNNSIHFLSTVAVFFLTLFILRTESNASKLSKKKQLIISFFTALIFGLHPVQTQAVTYIVQRMASMAALFYFIALMLYLHLRTNVYSLKNKIITGGSLIIISALGILSKENFVSIPLSFLLLEWLVIKRASKKVVVEILAGLIVVTLILTYFYVFQGDLQSFFSYFKTDPTALGEVVTPLNYLMTQPAAIVTYLTRFIYPSYLLFDYAYPLVNSPLDPRLYLNGLIILALLVLAFLQRKRLPLVTFGILFFFITLLPESSILPLPDVIVEHRMYLPTFGLSLASVILLFQVFKQSVGVKFLMVMSLIVIMLGFLTYQRNKVWANSEAFWWDIILKAPQNPRAHYNLGLEYIITYSDPVKALIQFNKVIELRPDYAQAYNNLGVLYMKVNDYESAIKYYTDAIRIDPENILYQNNLTEVLENQASASGSLVQ